MDPEKKRRVGLEKKQEGGQESRFLLQNCQVAVTL